MKKIQRFAFLLLGILAFVSETKATHNRAGEIRIEQIGVLTIRATIITYTKTSSTAADRDSVEVNWGDGTPLQLVRRVNGIDRKGEPLAGDIKRNLYVMEHTYAGRGTYIVGMADPNRNDGVLNVNFPLSGQVPFYISTSYTFLSSQFQGFNSTPQLLQPPVDKGCINKVFVHALNAYDPDGDSLAYRLTVPLAGAGQRVPLYDFPDRILPGVNNLLSLDERTGQLTWRSPQRAGEYNIAFLIISYRRGVAIDTTIRDMQILIENCQNEPPKVETIDKICVIAGQKVRFAVKVSDVDTGQKVQLTALGGPFVQRFSPAVLRGANGRFLRSPVIDTFEWQTTCEHIAEQPYSVVFKGQDNFFSDSTGAVDLKTVQIKVVAPAPEDVRVGTVSGQAVVSWANPYTCQGAADRYFYAFSVWRRENSNPFAIDTCTTGLAGKGYTRVVIDTIFPLVNGRYSYTDATVQRGKTYCYRIVAHFAKRTPTGNPFNLVESLPSNEACVQLKRDIPLIVNVDVLTTNANTGSIDIKWTRPKANDLDTLLNLPPYKVVLLRGVGLGTTNFQTVRTVQVNQFWQLTDTIFIDQNLNTIQNIYVYQVAFYAQIDTLIGKSTAASSHFLTASPNDRRAVLTWQFDVPWANARYDIFRKNNTTGIFDSVGSSTTPTYTDRGLINGVEYCYFVRASGSYGIADLRAPLLNRSQTVCVTPIDKEAPCAPTLSVKTECDNPIFIAAENIFAQLKWTNVATTCLGSEDVATYKLYLVDTVKNTVTSVVSTNGSTTNWDYRDAFGISACYAVTALDTVGNESKKSNIVCTENCVIYELPNTFTPNNDGDNDLYKPRRQRFVEKVDFRVVNQWGGVVFETTDPNLSWDGKNSKGESLTEGGYFYTCKIYTLGRNGSILSPNVLSGYIQIFNN